MYNREKPDRPRNIGHHGQAEGGCGLFLINGCEGPERFYISIRRGVEKAFKPEGPFCRPQP